MKRTILTVLACLLAVPSWADYQIKQSTTAYPLVFFMADASDPNAGKTGLSPTVTISKSGAAFAAPAGAVTEIAHGWYKVAGNATDSATLGPLLLHATATSAIPADAQYEVVAFDPQDSTPAADIVQVSGDTDAANNAESFFDGSGFGVHLLKTTVATVDNTTEFNLSEGPQNDVDLRGCTVIFKRPTGGTLGGPVLTVKKIIGYDFGASEVPHIEIDSAPDFLVMVGDSVEILPPGFAYSDDIEVAAVKTKTDFLPSATAGASGGLPLLDANLNVQADLEAVDDDTATAPNIEAMFDGTGYAGGTIKLGVNIEQILGLVAGAESFDDLYDGSTLEADIAALPGLTADGVWDEARASHTAAGSFGQGVASVQGSVTGSVLSVTNGVTVTTNNDKTGYRLSATGVDDVWDELKAGHTTPDSFGDFLDDEVSAVSTGGLTVEDIAEGVRTELTTELGRVDVALSTLATSSSLATVGTNVGTIITRIGTPVDVSLSNDIANVASDIGEVDVNEGLIADAVRTELTAELARILLALPAAAPAANGGLATVNASNYIAGIQGTANQLDDIEITVENLEIELTPLSPTFVNRARSWKFPGASSVTASNTITEAGGNETTGFNGLVEMDFSEPLPDGTVINTLGTPTITPTTNAPVLGSPSATADKRKVHIPVDCRTFGAQTVAAGTYYIRMPITTTDGQTINRRGKFVVQ